ncbi:hypothetical protein SAMN05428959_1011360 [Duganella sp. CF517]|uniref:hypothetical protein n=1 Tax=Duganella sp. CF517 TaxID=1881038 RepID=UPI0008B57BE6|nr:hypothetical protein [Duganella sp. CF517]SEN36152.1 hypothetical protein SAMN05428959_1011360 [Duganella sp. CF517]
MSKSRRKRKYKYTLLHKHIPKPMPMRQPPMSDRALFARALLVLAAIVAIIYLSYTEVYRPLVGGPRLNEQAEGIALYATFRGKKPMPAGALSPSILTPESRAWATERTLRQMPDASVSRMVYTPRKNRFDPNTRLYYDAFRRLDPEPDHVLNEWGGTIQVFIGEQGVLVAYDGVPRRLCEHDFEPPPFKFGFQCNGKFQYRH